MLISKLLPNLSKFEYRAGLFRLLADAAAPSRTNGSVVMPVSVYFWLLLLSSSSLTRCTKLVTSLACATHISISLSDANRTILITKMMRWVNCHRLALLLLLLLPLLLRFVFNFVLCHRKKSDDLSNVRPRLTTDLSCEAHFSCLAVEIECVRAPFRWFIDWWCSDGVGSMWWQSVCMRSSLGSLWRLDIFEADFIVDTRQFPHKWLWEATRRAKTVIHNLMMKLLLSWEMHIDWKFPKKKKWEKKTQTFFCVAHRGSTDFIPLARLFGFTFEEYYWRNFIILAILIVINRSVGNCFSFFGFLFCQFLRKSNHQIESTNSIVMNRLLRFVFFFCSLFCLFIDY